MNPDIQDSVVLITSRDGKNRNFGSGFVIRQVRGITYLLTCAHVIRDVGGAEKVKADGVDASVVASGEASGLDLAVLKVDGLSQRSVLSLREGGERGNTFRTVGFQSFGKDLSGEESLNRVQELRGTLGEPVGLQSRQWGDRNKAWELRVADDFSLQPGYSGSPVIDSATGKVFAVVSHRQGERIGLAISIEELAKIWNFPDSDQLYQSLLELGYRDQVQMFRQLARLPKLSGAFAIHGEEFYGQSWLLNRLFFKYIPERTTAKRVRIKLGIKVRHNDIKSLWQELGEWFGTEERHPTPAQIVDKVYSSWQTQHILLVLHEIERMPQAVLKQMIQQFWVPLMLKVQESPVQERKFKLLMFLVDYKGIVGSWEIPFAEQVNSTWKPEIPVRSPKLAEFSYDDLSEWLEDHRDKLPFELTKDINSAIENILGETDGVPEVAFDEICFRCGYEWEEESKKWLRH